MISVCDTGLIGFGSVVKRLQLHRLVPVDATFNECQTVLWTKGVHCVDVHSHASSKLAHGLDPRMVKAQTTKQQQIRKNAKAYSTPKVRQTTTRT